MFTTNYKFEVLADKAEKAVDIFSNFFVAPLFTSSGTGREVQAVDSENSKNLTADARRRLQILKDLADQTHYYSKFSTGNAKTLPTNEPEKLEWLRKALLAFHRKHYHPEKMTVVIAGPQKMDEMEEWIVSRYSQITKRDFPANGETLTSVEQLIEDAANDAPPYSFLEDAPPYNPPFKSSLQGSWPVLLTTKPLRSMRRIVMMFPIPSYDVRKTNASPSSMLSHLIGHEGVGSAFAVLQNHGMLSSLSAGPRTKAPDFTLFQVDMGLTEKGEQHWEAVVDVIFAYCRLVEDHANKDYRDLARIWGETSKLDRMFFDQTSPGGTYGYVPNIADSVLSYGTAACLIAGSLLEESEETFPADEFLQFVKLLTPENCIIERCSEEAYEAMQQKTDFGDHYGLQKEKWYGVEYYLAPINPKSILTWKGSEPFVENLIDKQELNLPKPNRYIPRTLELCPELPEEAKHGQRINKPIDPPKLIIDDKHWKLYHRLDDRYALPQSSLNLLIRNVSVHNIKADSGEWVFDSRTALLSSLLAGIFNEAMAQETYDADLAGLYWSLAVSASGIKLNCFGFSDRLPDLGLKILEDFLAGDFLTESFFDSSRDRVVRGLRTYFESRRADSHAMYYRDSLLASQDKGIDESLASALSLSFDDVSKHHKRVVQFNKVSVECLFSGNVASSDAVNFFKEARSKIEKAHHVVSESNVGSECIIPAPSIERLLYPGQGVELHFASKNSEEENGAVLCTYQSSIPSYKGKGISHPDGLLSSSAIRLLCHMLREPLFDDLRTKQQLGYIVSSYYEIGYSSQTNEKGRMPCTTPIDFISINILSRKVAPPEITNRIDEFLKVFRKSLVEMPESEIRDHAEALATKLLKPIQKLQTEASNHYARIQRYGPEVYYRNGKANGTKEKSASLEEGLPWETAQALASTIRGLSREDLLQTWDRMTHPSTRSRVVSCVYGKTFPLKLNASGGVSTISTPEEVPKFRSLMSWISMATNVAPNTNVVNNFSDLLQLRSVLPEYRPEGVPPLQIARFSRFSGRICQGVTKIFQQKRQLKLISLGVLGAAMIGSAFMITETNRRQRGCNTSGQPKVLASSLYFFL